MSGIDSPDLLEFIKGSCAVEIIEGLAAGLIRFSELRNYLKEKNKFVPNTLYKRLKEFHGIGLITYEYSRVRIT